MNSSKNNIKASMGAFGSKVINNSLNHTGNYAIIQVLADAVIESVTGNCEDLAGITLPQHTIIPGEFTQIKLSSGTVVVYNNVDA